jgi:hypothetical protein
VNNILGDLNFYANWANSHNVPFYIGEFGAIALAPGGSDQAYIVDTLQALKKFGMHWTYYALRGNLPYPLMMELISGSSENPNQYLRQEIVNMLSASFKN